MARNDQKEALERSLPKAFRERDKLTVNSKMLPEIKDWKTGEDYRLTEVIMTQIASHELDDGTIEAEFAIKSIKANGIHLSKRK